MHSPPLPMTRARLRAIGTYLPPDRQSNLARMDDFHIDATFLNEKIGVLARAVKDPADRNSDLCVRAFADLQARLDVPMSDIDLLCVVTQNPEVKIPHTAALLHSRLRLGKHCMTFDIAQGCAGYTHAIAIVTALMAELGLGHALVFTCDPYSDIVDRNDKNTALLFGDGATASYFSRGGAGYELLDTDCGTVPGSQSVLQCEQDRLKMDGHAVLLNAAREVPLSVRALLARNGVTTCDIEAFLFHQGSKHIVGMLRRELALDASTAPFAIADYGNTVSSSIPILLKQHLQHPRQTGTKVVLCGFGVGFCWGSSLIEFHN